MHILGPPSTVGFQGAARPAQNGTIMNPPPMVTVPLNTLIDYIIHKTYHDIGVMAELLRGKSDMERKIDIAHFANRTRQMFIRLLAVVKWAGSVGKVIKCEEITHYLDQQTALFIDTADKLHTLANQLVVQARLPNFAIPAAVDVLTTGTYPRLPRAIRDKIVPPDPITPQEKAATLKRLNQIIMYRLVTTNIPLQVMELIVDKGMAKLIVPREFQAILTLMGDEDDVPWRLLKLEFMVEDRETGSGRALVHDVQINYIHELVQSRLIANEDPLQDLYNVLHSFCLSLQLEVLQAQAIRLIRERWGRLVQIEEYQPGTKVVLSYWRLSPYKKARQEAFSLIVRQKQTADSWLLEVTHKPPLLLQSIGLVEKASKIRHLSIEQLLSDTVRVRTYHKLFELKQLLQSHIKNDLSNITSDKSCLVVPLLQPCQNNENLRISVDPQTGVYVPLLAGIEQSALDEMEKAINEVPLNLLVWIPKFRFRIARERCKMSIQSLPAVCVNTLSLTNKSSHPVGQLTKEAVYVRLVNFSDYYIIVELLENKDSATKILYKYHLLSTRAVRSRLSTDNPAGGRSDALSVEADVLVELATSICQADGDVIMEEEEDSSALGSHFNSELAQLVAVCDARIPFVSLTQELSREGFSHQGVMEEGINVGLSVKIISLPEFPASVLHPSLLERLLSTLLGFSYRLVDKSAKMAEPSGSKVWNAELVFCNNPLKTESQKSSLTHVMLHPDPVGSESPVKLFKDDWVAILKLYDPTVKFAETLEDPRSPIHDLVSVFSYDYKSLVLKYGQGKQSLVTIRWSTQSNEFNLLFGRDGSLGSNSHTMASHYLVSMFKANPDIGKLVQILHDTSEPLQAISTLPVIPLIGMVPSTPGTPQQSGKSVSESFTVVVQSSTHIRIIFRSIYGLDVYCLPNKKVSLRDAALSRFDPTKVKEGLLPIRGLKGFLSILSGQENRKRSAAERDDPPSPENQNSVPAPALGEMRTITRGVWAGSHPIILPQSAFSLLLKPPKSPNLSSPSILELFLGNTLIKKEIDHIVSSPPMPDAFYRPPPNLVQNMSNAPLTTVFGSRGLLFRCGIQFIQIKPQLTFSIQAAPPILLQERGLPFENWANEDLHILEQFFRMRVASPPFRASNACAFCTIISAEATILRDFVQVMRLELGNFQNDPNVKWSPQICLTVSPRLKCAPPGLPAIYIKDKILIFVRMTPKIAAPAQRQSIILPIVWSRQTNIIGTLPANNPTLQRLDALLKQMMERRQQNTECHMYMAVRYIMENFT